MRTAQNDSAERGGPGSPVHRVASLLRGLLAVALLTALTAGIPWGLTRYVGWPLPQHLPTREQIDVTLTTPMSMQFFLNVVACILWPAWAVFVADVLRTITRTTHALPRPSMPDAGPLQTLAAVLIGTVIISLLSQRTSASLPAPASKPPAVSVTATAPYDTSVIALSDFIIPAPPATGHGPRSGPAAVEVRAPRDGVYDSLWRIAQRTLGDGSRWREIYALNKDRPQRDGRALSNPNLIRPGWILQLPAHPSVADAHHSGHHKPSSAAPASPHPSHASGATTPSPLPTPDASPPTSAPPPPPSTTTPAASSPPLHAHESPRQPGISLPTGAFVGVGFAALISAALLTVRRRRRVRYRPGSGERDDLTIAPVVRALRLAHNDAIRTSDLDVPLDADRPAALGPALLEADRPADEDRSAPALPPPDGRVIGVKDGQALAWNLARARGLGLTGPGAADAIRAMLVALLAELRQPPAGPTEILIPAADAHKLIGEHTGRLARLHIVDDLDTALDTMENELLTRTRIHTAPRTDPDGTVSPRGDLVLVTTCAPHAERRLQSVLDNGSDIGLAGIVLGQWRPGGTARIRPDGTVAATSASVADGLTGARLFTLPTTDVQALLDLLRDAQPAPRPPVPRPPAAATPTPATVMGRPALDTGSAPLRPGRTRPRRRLPHGHAPTPPDAREQLPAEDRQNAVRPDDGQRHEPTPTAPDDDPSPGGTASRSRRVLEETSSQADKGTVPSLWPAADRPRDLDRAASGRPLSSIPADTAPSLADESPVGEADATEPLLHLAVLGRMRLTHHRTGGDEHADITPALAPKQREVLAYLALHRDGVRREALTTAIWPDAPRERPYNSFHATLSQLRRALRTATHDELSDITVHADGHYGLDREQLTVDLWQMQDALASSRRDTSEQQHRTGLERVVELYPGDLAADLTAEWLEAPREALRRDVLDTVSTLVRILRDDEPEQALALLERTRTLDRYNEAIYRDIARFQAHLGQHDAISRTLALLTATLTEIDEQPSTETVALYDVLSRRKPAQHTTRGRAVG